MAEYYAVLSRAVASLEANTPEARRAVYDKARNALIGQLKAIVPPLPTSEISRQRLELEEAIRRAEREAANAAGGAPQRPAARRPSPPPPPSPPSQAEPRAQVVEEYSEPPPPPAAANSPQEVFRRAIREAESRTDIAPPPIERAPVREEAYGDMGADFHVNDRPRRAPPVDQPPPYVPPDYRQARRTEPEPRLAPDYPWEADAPQREPAIPRHAPTPQLDGDDRPARIRDGRRRGGGDRDVAGDLEEKGGGRPSRLPIILLLVLIVGLVVGLFGIGYAYRGEISAFMANLDTGSSGASDQVAAAPPPPPPAAPVLADDTAAAAVVGKNDDRLPGSNAIATTPGVRVVGETGDAGDAASDTAGAPALATADAQQPPPAAQDGSAVLVAQKAVLYEEPLDSAKAAAGVTQINAAVTWDFVNDSTNGPSVIANLDVPDRGLKVKLTIHKNADSSLPASHLVEVIVSTTAAFPGKGIANIPRLVLKPSEDARGEPLVGATAKVADGFFWIALSALPADVDSNMGLLRDRGWIDLPLVYDTGQRAILTFEKGTPGDRALAQAMTAWTG